MSKCRTVGRRCNFRLDQYITHTFSNNAIIPLECWSNLFLCQLGVEYCFTIYWFPTKCQCSCFCKTFHSCKWYDVYCNHIRKQVSWNSTIGDMMLLSKLGQLVCYDNTSTAQTMAYGYHCDGSDSNKSSWWILMVYEISFVVVFFLLILILSLPYTVAMPRLTFAYECISIRVCMWAYRYDPSLFYTMCLFICISLTNS